MRRAIATSKEGERDSRGVFAPLLGERGPPSARQIIHYRIGPKAPSPALACPIRLPRVFRPLGRDATMDLDIKAALVPGAAIWSVRSDSGFESLPDDVPDVYSIRIPLRRGLLSRTPSREFETQVGSATILPAIDCLGSRFALGSHVLSCAVGVTDLVNRYRTLEGPAAPLMRLKPTVVLEGPRLQALVHTIRRIGDHIGTETEAMMSPLLVDLLLNQILSAWPMDQIDRTEEGPPSVVRRAIEFIEEHLGGALTVGEVATACGVSLRTLQALFRTRIGTTPLGYILERRLERAHADLLANDGGLQVSQIAHRWGFLHMGEFARRYRMRYGCTPSQTHRRRG